MLGEGDRRGGSGQINCQPQSLFTDGLLSRIKSASMMRLSTWQGTVARILPPYVLFLVSLFKPMYVIDSVLFWFPQRWPRAENSEVWYSDVLCSFTDRSECGKILNYEELAAMESSHPSTSIIISIIISIFKDITREY